MEHVFRLLVAQRFQLAFGGRIVGMLQQGVFCLCNCQGAIDGLLEDVAVDATHKNDVGAARSERCGTNKGHGRFVPWGMISATRLHCLVWGLKTRPSVLANPGCEASAGWKPPIR